MDGNGRWAQQRGWARIRGHRAGVGSVREITTACAEIGIEQLTLYAFSTENWKRPPREVSLLMRLLARFLVKERATIMENRIRLRWIGEISALPKSAIKELEHTARLSQDNDGMVLCLALNYGARQEIVMAARRLAERASAGELDPAAIDEAAFEKELQTVGMPDPDLLIRTGGEQRLSNYLLWQASYAELCFSEVLWPDFRRPQLEQALELFAQRERRFGDVKAAL
ncbi:di-trans,poly-cis-decaprenylcistransferase [bacterium AH-315-M10]|nr:di-trans,poly-cis-decaprenylcistransferase [bacterium AH-315-M10]